MAYYFLLTECRKTWYSGGWAVHDLVAGQFRDELIESDDLVYGTLALLRL